MRVELEGVGEDNTGVETGWSGWVALFALAVAVLCGAGVAGLVAGSDSTSLIGRTLIGAVVGLGSAVAVLDWFRPPSE